MWIKIHILGPFRYNEGQSVDATTALHLHGLTPPSPTTRSFNRSVTPTSHIAYNLTSLKGHRLFSSRDNASVGVTSSVVREGGGRGEQREGGSLPPPEWTRVVVRDVMTYTLADLRHFQEYVVEVRIAVYVIFILNLNILFTCFLLYTYIQYSIINVSSFNTSIYIEVRACGVTWMHGYCRACWGQFILYVYGGFWKAKKNTNI